MKLRQYRQGKAFCDEVAERRGIVTLNKVWRSRLRCRGRPSSTVPGVARPRRLTLRGAGSGRDSPLPRAFELPIWRLKGPTSPAKGLGAL